MRKDKKHIFSGIGRVLLFSVALIFFFSQSGFILWHSARGYCYHFIRVQRSYKERDTLIIPKQDFAQEVIWLKKDEISYRGRMFDVKKILTNEGYLTLTGHYDQQDDRLLEWLQFLFHRDDASHPGKKKISFWFCEAILPELTIPVYVTVFSKNSFANQHSLIRTFLMIPLGHPPELCS